MGNAASAFKDLYQRLVRRQRRKDRWVRDDKKKLIPDGNTADKKCTTPTHRGAVTQRIDAKVYDELLQKDITNKRHPEDPHFSFHDDLHRRHLALIHCIPSSSVNPSSSVTESFDSMASYVMNGTESFGVNFYSLEADARNTNTRKASSKTSTAESDDEGPARGRHGRKRHFADKAKRPISSKACIHNTIPAFDDEDASTDEEFLADDNNQTEHKITSKELAAVPAQDEFVFERFEVLVHSCNSMDASWCNDILLS